MQHSIIRYSYHAATVLLDIITKRFSELIHPTTENLHPFTRFSLSLPPSIHRQLLCFSVSMSVFLGFFFFSFFITHKVIPCSICLSLSGLVQLEWCPPHYKWQDFLLSFWPPCRMIQSGNLVPMAPEVEVWSPNLWTAREFPGFPSF